MVFVFLCLTSLRMTVSRSIYFTANGVVLFFMVEYYMWNPKKSTNKLIYKTEVESQMHKTNSWLPGDKVMGGINWKFTD